MSNPFSGSDTSGMNSMSDPLGFIKNLWGSMNIPGMVAPPMSLDELDKKIKDLKTVESWLSVNMNMLRGTIQALEVQRATIAALQSLSESFAQHAQSTTTQTPPANTSANSATQTNSQNSNADWPMPPGSHKIPDPAVENEEDEEDEEDDDIDMPPEHPETTANAPSQVDTNNSTTEQAAKTAQAPDASAPFATPAAWWGLLQDQFKQAVSKALESEPSIASSVTDTVKNTDHDKKPSARPKANSQPVTKSKTKPKTTAKSTTKPAAKTAPNKAKPVSKAAASTVVKTSLKTKPSLAPKKSAEKSEKNKNGS